MNKTSLLAFIIVVLLCSCEQKHYNEWVEKRGRFYYYDGNGEKVRNADYHIDNDWYYFGEKGEMLKGWHLDERVNKWVYLGGDGKVKNGWQKVDDKWYYFLNPYGYMAKDWQEIDNKWYFFDRLNGNLKTSTWVDERYYVDENGEMVKNGWYNVNGQMLYFDTDGSVNLSRNYESEISSSQRKQTNSKQDDLPEFQYIYNAAEITKTFKRCAKYYESVRNGNRYDAANLLSEINYLESLVAQAKGYGMVEALRDGIRPELEEEYTLLNTVIVGMKSFAQKKVAGY